MPPPRKRDKFVDLLSGLFTAKAEIRYTPDGPQRSTGPGGFFNRAHGFTLNNTAVTSVIGDNNTVTYVQGDRNLVSHVMGLLSQRIIPGAAHDSSARSPPPRCHPETRVKLIARMTAWFHSQAQQELVLWITGPAGVGKSAVVQTFAEYLIKLEFLGASVFFSRPNKRDNPHGVFITIAYQLATRIEAYRNFVVEHLSRDPELLSGDMEAQFRTFIVEPFARQKIGAGGKRWAILLDGLDELKGEDAQCDIIRLITTFVHDHPDAPLTWIIASRPEAHISDTFDEDDARRSCWSEHIPIDSTEACTDVERFFRSEFEAIRKKFRRSMPRDWPNGANFLELTAAALGLFVYAQVAMQFIRDPEHGDPVKRFELLLSVIDRSNATPMKDNPFAHLDMLYHEILSSIPSDHWSTTKQLFRCTINWTSVAYKRFPDDMGRLRTLRGMSILFGIPRHVIYTCLIKCQSVLKLPEWKVAHKSNFVLLHASFADYVSDSARSGEFYVGNKQDALEDMSMNVLAILNKCSRDGNDAVEAVWHEYCSQLDDERPSSAVTKYHGHALRDIASFLAVEMPRMSTRRAESSIYMQLLDIHMIRLSYYFDAQGVFCLVRDLMDDQVKIIGLRRCLHLKDLKFGHLDWKMMSPSRVRYYDSYMLHRPCSKGELRKFVSELESLQEFLPRLEVVIFGGVPEGRVAVFRNPLKDDAYRLQDFICYMIPYPE